MLIISNNYIDYQKKHETSLDHIEVSEKYNLILICIKFIQLSKTYKIIQYFIYI